MSANYNTHLGTTHQEGQLGNAESGEAGVQAFVQRFIQLVRGSSALYICMMLQTRTARHSLQYQQ
jgi:hypothetical protein